MEYAVNFLSRRTFDSSKKNKRYFLASFSSPQLGTFEQFVTEDSFYKLNSVDYLQEVILKFSVVCQQGKLNLQLDSLEV